MRFTRHTKHWWQPTDLRHSPVRIPASYRNIDPVNSGVELPKRLTGKVGAFAPSSRWVYYNRLQGVEVGYLTKLYSMKEVGLRYGLTTSGQRYFKKHIMPPPLEVVRRRNVSAHHWSLFLLMAMDVVLKDLERLGYQQFLARFDQHIDNLHEGMYFMADYYAEKYEQLGPELGDEYGVSWSDD